MCINKCGNGGANYRRFSAADTEALKRLAAIDSLVEAVSSDQQLSKIETLVDELSLKLRQIEEQNGLDDTAADDEHESKRHSDSQVDSIKKVNSKYLLFLKRNMNNNQNHYSSFHIIEVSNARRSSKTLFSCISGFI